MDPQSIITIPNGITSMDGVQGGKAAIVDHAPGELLAGLVGVLNERKGWQIAVEAVRLARENGLPWRLVIAGFGKDEQSVLETASRYAFVSYLGRIERAGCSLIPYLDALLLPSVAEGQPMVILEAMSYGVPVVATAVGAVPDMITSGVNGILAERTPAAFAAAICRLDDSAFRQCLGAAAADTVRRRFDMSAIAARYMALYEEAIQSHQPACLA
jgi:glycosyltransferase involved in cell wall biosynthesis